MVYYTRRMLVDSPVLCKRYLFSLFLSFFLFKIYFIPFFLVGGIEGCELVTHDDDGEHDHIPEPEPECCRCLGAPPYANPPLPEITATAKGGGKDAKGKHRGLEAEYTAQSRDAIAVTGTLSMLAVLVAAFAGVMYHHKTLSAVSELSREVAVLRQTQAEVSGLQEAAATMQFDSQGEFQSDAKARTGHVNEATMLLE